MHIGFIGLGRIGLPMAQHVLDGGHEMRVFDLRREAAEPLIDAGAAWADSPREAAVGAEIVFTSLPGPPEVLEAALGETGVFQGMAPGGVYADLSTISPEAIEQVARAAQTAGVEVLDCPVSGGVEGAKEGTLCLMAGGNAEAFARVRPVLELIGDPDKVIHCGPLGSGSVCKIVNNLIGLSTSVVLSEAFTLGMRAGVDARILFEVISRSTGNSNALQGLPDTVFVRDFEPGFRLALGAKDVRLATDLGRRLGVPLELSNLVDQQYTDAMRRGLGPLSSAAVVILQEERAGVEIREATEGTSA